MARRISFNELYVVTWADGSICNNEVFMDKADAEGVVAAIRARGNWRDVMTLQQAIELLNSSNQGDSE
jgi:hypothetical protein